MKEFLKNLSEEELKIAEKIIDAANTKSDEQIKGLHPDIVEIIGSKLMDAIDQSRVNGYALEATLDKIAPVNNFSQFQKWADRRGLHVNGEEARQKLAEIIQSNPNFDFNS